VDQSAGGQTLNQRLYVQTDANNDVISLTSASGQVLQRYSYTPYGTQTTYDANWNIDSTPQYAITYGFQDGRVDSVTGYIQFGARDYSTSMQVWLEMDPIGFAGGTIVQTQFVGDNPVNSTDPSGLAAPNLMKRPLVLVPPANAMVGGQTRLTGLGSAQGKQNVVFVSDRVSKDDPLLWNSEKFFHDNSPPGTRVYKVSSVEDIVKILENGDFPNGSIQYLVLSGHNGGGLAGCGCAFANDTYINQDISSAMAKRIAVKLTPTAEVDIYSCGAGNNTGSMLKLANKLQARIVAPAGDVKVTVERVGCAFNLSGWQIVQIVGTVVTGAREWVLIKPTETGGLTSQQRNIIESLNNSQINNRQNK
jgi:RHS repeat-associated protein